MLEFDGQALDPAIVSAQPMKPAQTVGLQQMGLVSGEYVNVTDVLHVSVLYLNHICRCCRKILEKYRRNGISLFI